MFQYCLIMQSKRCRESRLPNGTSLLRYRLILSWCMGPQVTTLHRVAGDCNHSCGAFKHMYHCVVHPSMEKNRVCEQGCSMRNEKCSSVRNVHWNDVWLSSHHNGSKVASSSDSGRCCLRYAGKHTELATWAGSLAASRRFLLHSTATTAVLSKFGIWSGTVCAPEVR